MEDRSLDVEFYATVSTHNILLSSFQKPVPFCSTCCSAFQSLATSFSTWVVVGHFFYPGDIRVEYWSVAESADICYMLPKTCSLLVTCISDDFQSSDDWFQHGAVQDDSGAFSILEM